MGVRKAQKWSNLAVFRGPDPTAGGFSGGVLENGGDEGSVSMRFRGAVSGRQMAGFLARWKPGSRRPFVLRRFMKKCTCWYAPCLKAFVPPPRGRKCSDAHADARKLGKEELNQNPESSANIVTITLHRQFPAATGVLTGHAAKPWRAAVSS